VHGQVTNELVGNSDVCLRLLKKLSENTMVVYECLSDVHIPSFR
jgi:hypothetical protein